MIAVESITTLPVSRPDAAWAAEAIDLLLQDTRSAETRRAYAGDLRQFFTSMGQDATPAAVSALCSLDAGSLALVLNRYKAELVAAALSEATVNRRLAAVRSLLRTARRLGSGGPDPGGLVSSERVVTYRDTRGPALAETRLLLAAPDRHTLAGSRDYALLRLLCENALRRGEVVGCNVSDFDAAEKRLFIRGKGRGTQKEPITLSPATVGAIADYLQQRRNPGPDAPLFATVAHFAGPNDRLTGRGLAHIINEYGLRVLARPLHPHALRHGAITATLDCTDGNVRMAQRLSRHADIRTLQRYDDNRTDLQGAATNLLSGLLGN